MMNAADEVEPTGSTAPPHRGTASGQLTAALLAALLAVAAVRFAAVRAESPLETMAAALLGEGDRRPTLVYVFQRGDCPTLEALFGEWAALDRTGAVRSVAVGLRFPRSPDARRNALDPDRVEIPVYFELARSAEELILRLGYRATPVVLLLDGEGRLRLALPVPIEPAGRRSAVAAIREHALRLPAPPPL